MAKKGNGPADEDADVAALDKIPDSLDGILPPLDDSVLNYVLVQLDDFPCSTASSRLRKMSLTRSSGASMGCRI
jgi:hypothetical protein